MLKYIYCIVMSIKQVIKDHGVTTQQIAEALNISQQAVSQAINGNPSLSRIKEIARVVGVSPSELIADDPDAPQLMAASTEVKIGEKRYQITIKEL